MKFFAWWHVTFVTSYRTYEIIEIKKLTSVIIHADHNSYNFIFYGLCFLKIHFSSLKTSEFPKRNTRVEENFLFQMGVLFIIHIGIHLVLLITTGIITTVIYCNYEEDETGHFGSTAVCVKPTQSRLAHIKDQRTYTSQSFHYSGFHERLSPIQTASQDNLDIVQGKNPSLLVLTILYGQSKTIWGLFFPFIIKNSDRKLPTLPNSNFEPIHSTAKRDPAFIRSAPNLNRIHSVNPYSHPLPPKSTDESTSGKNRSFKPKWKSTLYLIFHLKLIFRRFKWS